MFHVVEVKLREEGKLAYYQIDEIKPKPGDLVIVEADRGIDYGEVTSDVEMVLQKDLEEPLRKVVRIATKDDVAQIKKNKEKIKDVFNICTRKIQERNTPMKLVDAEYSFDRTKVILYFTADGRVDFRDLVKDLAHIFRVRIELKQIGVRDETKFFGGIGQCGRSLCCATFLKDFAAISIKMAKEQGLPLNPTKISGVCGRLMCCLGYESQSYRELLKGMPRAGDKIKTKQGPGKVISVNPLKQTVIVELEEGRQIEVPCEKK